jgi:phosphomannomutase
VTKETVGIARGCEGEGIGVNERLVRRYDLRGVVGRDLTENDARALGLAYAAHVGRGAAIAVCYDGRLSSPALEIALVKGLVAGGIDVRRVGRGPTGMLYFAVHEHGLDGGIMVTGSHNPADQNGFKLLCGAEPVYGAALAALVRTPPALRVGWDAGSGATGDVLRRLTAMLPGEHRLLHAAIDGRFPAHHPDPSVPENLRDLQALVTAESPAIGIAFDGDRIGVVDRTGAIVWPDQLMLYLAKEILRDAPGAAVVADVKSCRVLFDGIAAAGGQAIMAPSGYVLVREAMRRAGAPFAGELSGHLFFADRWNGTDDALHVAMRLLAAHVRGGDLAAFRARLAETFATPELRLACPDDRKAAVLAGVERRAAGTIDRTDGLRVIEPDGWWLLRASGTEPKLTARIEAWSAAGLARIEGQLRGWLGEEGVT